MARVLVTGCGGFVGRTLVTRMVAAGHEVWGVDRAVVDDFPGAGARQADLNDRAATARLVEDTNPDWIAHLAAQASVRRSYDEPYETIVNNTLPALHLLCSLRDTGRSARMLAVGSADEYGVVSAGELPIREETPVRPASPYALAKSIQNQCCRGFATLYNVDVVITRSFNHTGAGQRDDFVLPSFARQVVEIKLGRRKPVIEVGNLEVRRDFSDVRDVCDAYTLLLEEGRSGETYNVCSGSSHGIRDLLDRMCALAGVEVEVRVDPERLRPVDMPELRGDAAKIREHTGWSPSYDIEDTLRSLLDYWEERLRADTRA